MDKELSKKVLFIGVDYRKSIGGVAAVEHQYTRFIKPFKYVRTSAETSQWQKLVIAVVALFHFTWLMLTDREIKIVHVHGSTYASFWRKRVFINIARFFNKKIVYHSHGGAFRKFASEYPKAVARTLAKADCIIALSKEWKHYFADEMHCPRVEIVNNVVPHPADIVAGKSSDAGNVLRFTFLGKIMDAKGIYDFVEVIYRNREAYAGRLHLTIGGNGETDRIQAVIKEKGLESLVTFAGWVGGEKKEKLLAETDVYVLPSYFEGLPISILEAMSYGKAILATNVGGIPEIVSDGENGILHAPGNLDAIKRAIDTLLADPEARARMGVESLRKVRPYYPENVDSALTELYRSILQEA